jgi:two-component system C4-dicarboxylate transport response regulator DctD
MAPKHLNTPLDWFVAISPAMAVVLRAVDCYARARTPLVLVGATGTGKTTLAKLIHALSGRSGPFTAHTAGEFDPNLERSQIFGHERGAFTNALSRHLGILEEGGEGTLLLDDFHHVPRSTQTLLLRALDGGAFRRVGGSRDLPVRCRMIIGLAEPPDILVDRGTLLAELRFRLGYSLIRLPPLEERRDDIPTLAQRFLERCPAETGEPGPGHLTPEVLAVFGAAVWPGNLRQLEMVVRDAYLRARRGAAVRLEHLSDLVSLPARFERRGDPRSNAAAIRAALVTTQGDVAQTARLLHTARSTVYRYLPPPARHARPKP